MRGRHGHRFMRYCALDSVAFIGTEDVFSSPASLKLTLVANSSGLEL